MKSRKSKFLVGFSIMDVIGGPTSQFTLHFIKATEYRIPNKEVIFRRTYQLNLCRIMCIVYIVIK